MELKEIESIILNPISNDSDTVSESILEAVKNYAGDHNALQSMLRIRKQELRTRNVPGNTCDTVVEGTYLDDIPGIIMDDRIYKAITDAERILDNTLTDDVDLRTVTQLYLELVDIVAVDLKEACAECRKYPFEKNINQAIHCINLIEMLMKASAAQLSLYSSESPASMRSKCAKAIARCKEHVSAVTHGTGIDAPELQKALDNLCNLFWTICEDKMLADLQNRRNIRYREDHKKLHDWLTQKVMEMNGEIEALDLTDLTQRRYLAQLIALSQDVLNDYNADH